MPYQLLAVRWSGKYSEQIQWDDGRSQYLQGRLSPSQFSVVTTAAIAFSLIFMDSDDNWFLVEGADCQINSLRYSRLEETPAHISTSYCWNSFNGKVMVTHRLYSLPLRCHNHTNSTDPWGLEGLRSGCVLGWLPVLS